METKPATHPRAVQKTWTIRNRYDYIYAKICIFPTVSLSNGRRLTRLRDIRTSNEKRGVWCLTLLSGKVTSQGRSLWVSPARKWSVSWHHLCSSVVTSLRALISMCLGFSLRDGVCWVLCPVILVSQSTWCLGVLLANWSCELGMEQCQLGFWRTRRPLS